jgi:hypothetical protein
MLLILILLSQYSLATVVPVDIYDTYIPSGYDTASNAEVALHLFIPDDCHHWEGYQVTHESPFVHEVRAFLDWQPGFCFRRTLAATKLISLGLLRAGKHQVRFFAKNGTYLEKEMWITAEPITWERNEALLPPH